MEIQWLLIFTLMHYSACHIFTEKEHALLPPLYEMDNYTECKMQNNLYCQADFTLSPLQNTKLWELIQISRKEKFMFSRDVSYRTLCVPQKYENIEDRKHFAERIVNEKLKPFHLAAKIDDIVCYRKLPFDIFSLDFGVSTYIIFVLLATFIDKGQKSSSVFVERAFQPFSLKKNFKKLFQTPSKDSYQKLKCIQGIRVLACIAVILDHSKVSHLMSNHEVTREFEEAYSVHYYWFIFDYFVIQIFLVISPWLLTLDVLDLYEKNGRFTVKDVFLMFINRCLRLWPVLIAIVFILRNSYGLNKVLDLTTPKVIELSDKSCRTNWMATVFFYQNFYFVNESCSMGAWYVSADVQLYGISLIILYLTLKTKSTAILKLSLLLSYLIFACIIYFKKLDVVFRPYPDFFHLENMGRSSELMYLYLMTHVHASTYLLGICFGMYYHTQKSEKIQVTKAFVIFWALSFFGLPVLVIGIASRVWTGVAAALVGPLLKPLFAFGFAVGILGMSRNVGGPLKRFLECRPLEILCNITYSTYIFHFIAAFERALTPRKLLKTDGYTLVNNLFTKLIRFSVAQTRNISNCRYTKTKSQNNIDSGYSLIKLDMVKHWSIGE
ncbi:unnamed protein product [Callosobruchus maculatus]|uniref:Acyltransferase 3 domain-containing protein n=2 Tax=Callosobruchus maculatus TaxID=64391 RepID=A0A653BR77_CALMS|nr:unnamed protein product [Callosobruchus maculatus]